MCACESDGDVGGHPSFEVLKCEGLHLVITEVVSTGGGVDKTKKKSSYVVQYLSEELRRRRRRRMYIYHVLINALNAHMIHINLNMIFYTHVEHSPTKTIYIKYYKKIYDFLF